MCRGAEMKHVKELNDRSDECGSAVQPPFNVPQYKGLSHLAFNFESPKSVISLSNFLHLRFSSVYSSNSLIPKETLNEGFILLFTFIGCRQSSNILLL
jgi:hypothetical protein